MTERRMREGMSGMNKRKRENKRNEREVRVSLSFSFIPLRSLHLPSHVNHQSQVIQGFWALCCLSFHSVTNEV